MRRSRLLCLRDHHAPRNLNMKSYAMVVGLLVGCTIAAATGYFSASGINEAPPFSFIWYQNFPLSIYPPIILPLLAVYIVLMMEVIGVISATCDVSRLEVEGKLFDSRIQGGILADGLNGLIAGLCTITPMSTFAQNNDVVVCGRRNDRVRRAGEMEADPAHVRGRRNDRA